MPNGTGRAHRVHRAGRRGVFGSGGRGRQRALPRCRFPQNPGREPGITGGYGWPLIQRLARSVEITATVTGKTIRVTLPL